MPGRASASRRVRVYILQKNFSYVKINLTLFLLVLLQGMSKPKKPTAVVFLRVSTKSQDTTRQRNELMDEARKREWEVLEVIEEKISGTADEEDRDGLSRMRELAESGAITKVMVHEVSRLGRLNSVTHKFVEDMTDAGVSIYWHAQGVETILPSGKQNTVATVLLALLAELARVELETLKERIVSGLENARASGKILGRPKGTSEGSAAFLTRNKDAVTIIRKHGNLSFQQLSKLTGKSKGTVVKIRRILEGGAE